MNFIPKLVAFDLDGTLAESKQRLTIQMGELLEKLLQHMPVAIMSGGSWKQFEIQLIPSLPTGDHLKKLYLMPVSAAQCFIYQDEKWKAKYDNTFTEAEKKRILQALKESLAATGLDKPPAQVWGEQIEDRNAQITWSGLGQQAPIDAKTIWDPDRRKRIPVRDELLKRLPDVQVGVNAYTSIDITRKGITKAYGIRKLIELTGISISQMLYVGDALQEGGNDAVVIETGIKTHQVFGPEETAQLIEQILKASAQPGH